MLIQGKEYNDGEIIIYVDYSTSECAGAGGCFQVVDVCIDEESILNQINIDQGWHYNSGNEVIDDLKINSKKVDYRIEEV